MNYNLHHHLCCRNVISVSKSNGPVIDPSFDPITFLIICLIDVPIFDPIHCPSIVPSRDPSLSRGSSLYPFVSNYESNVNSDNISRVDSSTNPSFDPSSYLIMCPIDNPSRDPGLHLFDSSSKSYIHPDNVSRFESSTNPGISPKSVKLPCNDLDCYPSQHVHLSCIPSASTRAYPIVAPSASPIFAPTFVSHSNSRFLHEYYNDLLPSLYSFLFTSNNPDLLSDDSCMVEYIGSTTNQILDVLFNQVLIQVL